MDELCSDPNNAGRLIRLYFNLTYNMVDDPLPFLSWKYPLLDN